MYPDEKHHPRRPILPLWMMATLVRCILSSWALLLSSSLESWS